MFLCGRCRCQVIICSSCDRGQIYCSGTCAQEARRDAQREARRRYQKTPRGRALHADRNRRYRARRRRVTDHGLPQKHKTGLFRRLEVDAALSEPSPSEKPSRQQHCHHCGRMASQFLRLSAFPPGRRRGQNSKTAAEAPCLLPYRPHSLSPIRRQKSADLRRR